MNRKVITEKPVRVEYDRMDGERVVKELPNALKARAFYERAHKAGRRPKVVK